MLTKTNNFSMSMIQLIPNFPVNVNFYFLQQSSAQLPVAVRGKYSADFLWYFSPGDCSCCSTISQDTFKVKLPTIKKTNRLDIYFCVENKHKVMHRWPRYKISLLADLPRFSIFQKVHTVQQWNSHCPKPHVNKSDSSVFLFSFTLFVSAGAPSCSGHH